MVTCECVRVFTCRMDRRTAAFVRGQFLTGLCPGCRKERAPVCSDCVAALAGSVARIDVDGRVITHALRYEPPISNLLIAFKDRGEWTLRNLLALLLARSIAHLLLTRQEDEQSAVDKPLLLVPVASTAASIRLRDADPIADLAISAARILRRSGSDVRTKRLLTLRSGHRDHVGLSRRERESNMRDAFTVDSRIGVKGVHGDVVIVDDVVTTGATLAAAHGALSTAGFQVLGAAVIARSQRN